MKTLKRMAHVRTRTRFAKRAVSGLVVTGLVAATGCGGNPSEADETPLGASQGSLLAEIKRPDATIRFLDVGDGVIVTETFRIGATPPSLGPSQGKLSLEEQFQRLAPGLPVPDALRQAAQRVRQPQPAEEQGAAEVEAQSSAGKPEKVAGELAPSIGQVRSELTSSQFFNQFCTPFGGVSFSWCFVTAFQGAFATKKTHRSQAAICSPTTTTRFRLLKAGSTKLDVQVPVGFCTVGSWHDSHNLFGSPNKGTIRWEITAAPQPAQFSGYTVEDDFPVIRPAGF